MEGLRRPLLFLCVGGFLALFWSQALHVPFWQDDYYFLLDAQRARLAGEPWHAAFFPEAKVPWWRPLGERTYWRFVEGPLGGTARAAHVANILLLLAASAAVGWFVSTFVSRRVPEHDAGLAGLLAALLYGVHSAHFLPAAWASAANASLGVLFSALALRFWLVVTTSWGRRAAAAGVGAVVCFVLALLSRDIAFVLPALGLLLTLWLRPRYRPSAAAAVVGVLCVGTALIWLQLRSHFTLPADPAYEFQYGVNLLRNAAALVLFVFNVPFEALRFFFFVRPSFGAAAWGLASFLLQAGALILLIRGAREHLRGRELAGLAAFYVLGCAPYFPLSINCYPYYTSIGLLAYAIAAGLAVQGGRRVPQVLLLAILSSTLATLGNFFLDSPSHIGRARWAERQLVRLEAVREARPELFAAPLVVVVEDEHRFLGFRAEGLAYRLGIDLADIQVAGREEPVTGRRPALVVPREGDVKFRTTEDGS
ncbi:MAG: hypothetical protein SCH98_10225 [Deferrisomatales bacterium]|nr:hypothetical protein [Deferrisomatales bacterium]